MKDLKEWHYICAGLHRQLPRRHLGRRRGHTSTAATTVAAAAVDPGGSSGDTDAETGHPPSASRACASQRRGE